MIALDAIWWGLSAHLAGRTTWRLVIAIFMGAQMIGLLWIIFGRLFRPGWNLELPKFAASAVFIWHFIGLGLFVLVAGLLVPFLIVKAVVQRAPGNRPAEVGSIESRNGWTRREFIGFAATFGPPLFTLSLSGIALSQLNRFRIRRFVLPIPGLPAGLDGLTIAQVSDMHVGRFTSGRVLRDMVDAVNELRADLVLLTGDLINDALADLDDGIALVRAMDPRSGLFLIEGNHDLIENPSEFESRVRASGIPFLLDQSAVVSLRGEQIQLLGLSWTRTQVNRDEAIAGAVRRLLEQRRANAFPILLAHHPHAFDAAAESGMPLTLSGHTHGGQLMWNEHQGFGPALFKYWSGLYTRGDSKLIVSNGVGNWFPLRVNAPAEVVHLTLRRS